MRGKNPSIGLGVGYPEGWLGRLGRKGVEMRKGSGKKTYRDWGGGEGIDWKRRAGTGDGWGRRGGVEGRRWMKKKEKKTGKTRRDERGEKKGEEGGSEHGGRRGDRKEKERIEKKKVPY